MFTCSKEQWQPVDPCRQRAGWDGRERIPEDVVEDHGQGVQLADGRHHRHGSQQTKIPGDVVCSCSGCRLDTDRDLPDETQADDGDEEQGDVDPEVPFQVELFVEQLRWGI